MKRIEPDSREFREKDVRIHAMVNSERMKSCERMDDKIRRWKNEEIRIGTK